MDPESNQSCDCCDCRRELPAGWRERPEGHDHDTGDKPE